MPNSGVNCPKKSDGCGWRHLNFENVIEKGMQTVPLPEINLMLADQLNEVVKMIASSRGMHRVVRFFRTTEVWGN
jgi:hypothetical protein